MSASSKETASERTMRWQRENPEKYERQKREARARKIKRRNESIMSWNASENKTPMKAIKAKCRACRDVCNDRCHLFPYKYGDPRRMILGMDRNNLQGYKKTQESKNASSES